MVLFRGSHTNGRGLRACPAVARNEAPLPPTRRVYILGAYLPQNALVSCRVDMCPVVFTVAEAEISGLWMSETWRCRVGVTFHCGQLLSGVFFCLLGERSAGMNPRQRFPRLQEFYTNSPILGVLVLNQYPPKKCSFMVCLSSTCLRYTYVLVEMDTNVSDISMVDGNTLSAEICSTFQLWIDSCSSSVTNSVVITLHFATRCILDHCLLRLNGKIWYPTFGDLFHARQFAIHKLHETVGVFSRFCTHHGRIVAAE